jgi:hypothetical protein
MDVERHIRHAMVAWCGLVEEAAPLGDAVTAAAVYELLLPYAGRPVAAGHGRVVLGSVQRILGQAALAQGDTDRATARPSTAELDRPQPDPFGPPTTIGRSQAGARGRQPATAICRLGRQWDITVGGHRARVRHMRGVGYLAVLIANPGQEIKAVELAAGPGQHAANIVTRTSTTTQPLLDDTARRHYRHRLTELAEQIHRHESAGDLDKADQLHDERNWLIAQLAAAAGHAGRSRKFADNDERARIAVGKAIRRAIERIASVNPALGRHLQDRVHTGIHCWYQPHQSW